jgi:hypothetical protein
MNLNTTSLPGQKNVEISLASFHHRVMHKSSMGDTPMGRVFLGRAISPGQK